MKIAKESWIILGIGLADLATTIIFIQHHGAQEANPLFKRYWEMGLSAFIMAKMALLLGPLYVLEWARKRNPLFVGWALRGAIAAYLIMYGVGFVKLNGTRTVETEPANITRRMGSPIVRNHRRYPGTNKMQESDATGFTEGKLIIY